MGDLNCSEWGCYLLARAIPQLGGPARCALTISDRGTVNRNELALSHSITRLSAHLTHLNEVFGMGVEE